MENTARPAVTAQYILDHFDEAMERKYIEVYCQPVIRTVSGDICGLEALARWEDPELGRLTPDKFIGVLEESRRIHELDAYIIRQTCEAMREMMDTDAFVPVSVNLSRLDYELCDIFEVVESAVRANKIPRSHICIEITESLLNSNEELMRSYINRFQWAGYPVWMDDFGSGYSSLNVLKDYCFDELKIDMRFLSDFHPRSKQILASIINMAKHIGIQTLTEGVENREQFEYLRNIGCDKAQGNLFGAAMPLRACMDHARAHGLTWEPPLRRKYYDELGRLNFLSATPFILSDEQEDPEDGRNMNSIPLAVLELRGNEAAFLYTNRAFDDTVAGVDWQAALAINHDPLKHPTNIPLERFSPALRRLAEETRSSGKGRMHFVHYGEYYEIRTRRIASGGDLCGVLVRIINLSRGAEVGLQNALDEGLRQVYSLFERVSVLDLETMTVEALYLDSHEELFTKRDARTAARIYAEESIFPEDRERYFAFTDVNTLAGRLDSAGEEYLSDNFRARGYHGAYVWTNYNVVRIRRNVYYVLARNIEQPLRRMGKFYAEYAAKEESAERDGFPVDVLWNSVKRFSPLKFFWKDKERRFKGASQSFLEYFGFDSLDEILGKTDEDMHWHVHPDDYRTDEECVLREGTVILQRPGTCIARGENRNIVASKTPIYNAHGEINGLIGYFSEAERDDCDEVPGAPEQIRQDKLTGLLNTRALDEDMSAFRDEYELRGRDFARVEICVEELGAINRRYGYDFGDKVLCALARALVDCCGRMATIGRETGSQFVVLSQFESREEVDALVRRIRNISAESLAVDGMPFNTYLSVGAAAYSESESLDVQMTQTQLRRVTDDVESVPPKHLRKSMLRIFYLYDDLPMAYAVYKLVEEDGKTDAVLLYGNKRFAELIGRTPEEFTGRRVMSLFEGTDGIWMDFAGRAAHGESITKEVYYKSMGLHMIMTASQVIGEGFCAFTYLMKEEA